MKTLSFQVAAALGLASIVAGCGVTRQQTAQDTRPPRLQVTVNVPPTMSILHDEEIAEAFAYRVASILHEEGFRGRIGIVDGDPLFPNVPVLAINLLEWRVDRIGNVDCTFGAELQSPRGNHRLGMFSGTAMMTWSRRDWFARARDFEDAARDAIENLATRLEQTGMIEPVR